MNAEHGGPGAGVLDENGVHAVAARPSAGYGGQEKYATLWEKAAVLLHGIATTQNFSDGNKRTAWLAMKTFLGINGQELRDLPTITSEAMVLLVASDKTKFESGKVAEWLEENRLRASDRVDFAVLGQSIEGVAEQPNKSFYRLPVQVMAVPSLPFGGALYALVRINWYSIDAGRDITVRMRFKHDSGGVMLTDRVLGSITGHVERHWDKPWFPNGIQSWNEYLALGVMTSAEAQTVVQLMIDDEVAWEESLTVALRPSAPDVIPNMYD
ncbi:type II toxin-antitoxin system death-on-curing family toxin [Paenarthrobacter sp. OM7]|uniref:type II toxin-antitoxin system death-on-curing family toxin n=1 Tax=Paenarthrobacter sp. OM7 TaxID=3041264 RepID=UPI0024684CFE|nr:type II toxin-antitoxin system death-on-curing family toxin [Paenarthrobacter sp. OM7]WGM21879.1 type II toxin-antitoxin system death-on-curing family toxin [Paenarthrobacter sp. OM7]